jgi:hypothetical protein
VRLLKIEIISDLNQEQQRVSLVHTKINEAPPYEALSYTWGSNVRDRILLLNGGITLDITENLESAILGVVRHCSTGFIWIDQTCVDQDADMERNEQVKNMGRIYSSCFQALVWLGLIDLPQCDALGWV